MNHLYLSPHFPPNYHNFCIHLRRLGVNVLGLDDEPFEWLRPDLREALTEYYRVADMHSYEQMLRACGYFIHHYALLSANLRVSLQVACSPVASTTCSG